VARGASTALDRFEGRSSLKTWIFRILTNIAKTPGRWRERAHAAVFSGAAGTRGAACPRRPVDRGPLPRPPSTPRWPGHWVVKPMAWPEESAGRRPENARLAWPRAIRGAAGPRRRAVISLRDHRRLVRAKRSVNASRTWSETNQRVLLHPRPCKGAGKRWTRTWSRHDRPFSKQLSCQEFVELGVTDYLEGALLARGPRLRFEGHHRPLHRVARAYSRADSGETDRAHPARAERPRVALGPEAEGATLPRRLSATGRLSLG